MTNTPLNRAVTGRSRKQDWKNKMTEGEKAGWWVIVHLLMVGVAAYFTILVVIFSFS
jgi:hypothetical protein